MATRSLIGRENSDGTVDYIHCHFDGHLSQVGRLLFHHWFEDAALNALIALGHLAVLGTELGTPHPFERRRLTTTQRRRTWCTAFGRDRGDTDSAAHHVATAAVFRALQGGADPAYLHRHRGEWEVTCQGTTRPLGEALGLSALERLDTRLP